MAMDDRNRAAEEHIGLLLRQLSLQQKVRLVSGGDFWSTCTEPEIGLGRIVVSDGPAGVRGEVLDERDPSACLPSPTALAATWDGALVARLAELLAADARRKGVHVVLGPTLNLQRSPLSGRHFECFSEDPLLTSRIGEAYVRALQSFGIGATPKHYVANDSETDRFTVDVRIDERTLREVYLAPFEHAVVAGAWLVMAAYNGVNGDTMTENPLLSEPLKGEWGFDGVVVSDWMAVRSTAAAGAAKIDLAMPGPWPVWSEQLAAAVRAGQVPEAAIDDKVRRILRLASRLGVLDGVTPPPAAIPQPADAANLLREAAASAMVLVRNDGGLLPLDANAVRRIAVIGPNAAEAEILGGGSALVVPDYKVSPLEGIRAALGERVDVNHHVGVNTGVFLPLAPVDVLVNPATGGPGVRVRFLDANGAEVRAEDRVPTQLLCWVQDILAGIETVELRAQLRCHVDGVHQLGVVGVGAYRLEVAGTVLIDEVLERGDDPYITFPHRSCDVNLTSGQEIDVVLTHRLTLGKPAAVFMLGLREPGLPEHEAMGAAVASAEAADVAVVVVGTSWRTESEGVDRVTMALPGHQNELVRAVAKANRRTVVVVNCGAPMELPWHTDVPAVLLSWFPGQEFGNALADVLFGVREPGGRLPTTWAARQKDVPVLRTRPSDGRLHYVEGPHIGYRAWARAQAQPMYTFGHGLGYTTWEYRSVEVVQRIRVGDPIVVWVRLANTGARKGREVVQVYLRRPNSRIERPALWLSGFTPVVAAPGEEVKVEVEVSARAFQHWSIASGRWETETGTYTVLAGRSAADLPLHTEVTLTETGPRLARPF